MSKPALTIEPEYRSDLEREAAAKLTQAGVPFSFEGMHIPYIVPEREAKYLPDFHFDNCPIIIEPKGRFGGSYAYQGKRFGNSKDAAVKERQKFVLLRDQHPSGTSVSSSHERRRRSIPAARPPTGSGRPITASSGLRRSSPTSGSKRSRII
jgi:hypothetical protein